MDTELSKFIGQVSPEIDLKNWRPVCPICSITIAVDVKSYFLFAQRHWCYGSCSSCEKQFLLDVPALLYNLWYPQIMDTRKGQIYGKDNWWKVDMYNIYFTFFANKPDDSEPAKLKTISRKFKTLVDIIKMGDYRILSKAVQKNFSFLPQPTVKKKQAQVKPALKIIVKNASNSEKLVLFNCIDEYYGHTTCFIEYVYIIWDRLKDKLKQEGIATAILIPEYLQFYVPDFIDEVWLAMHLPSPFGVGTFRDVDFNNQLNQEIKRRQTFIPNQWINRGSGVDVRRYFHMDVVEQKANVDLKNYSHIFVFYNREDYRSWGGDPKREIKNYSQLASLIKQKYPSAGVFLVGMKKNYPIDNPNIVDWRTNGIPDNHTQRQIDYLYLLSKTDCAVGIHGSHMTEISALAKSVVTLQPESRYKNYTDDMFIIKTGDFIAEFNRFFSIFGQEKLDDVSAKKVFKVIEAALHRFKEAYPSFKGYSNNQIINNELLIPEKTE